MCDMRSLFGHSCSSLDESQSYQSNAGYLDSDEMQTISALRPEVQTPECTSDPHSHCRGLSNASHRAAESSLNFLLRFT
jgi:hypothetical protein